MVNPLARRSGAEGGAEGGECVQNKRNVVLGSEHGVIPPLPPSLLPPQTHSFSFLCSLTNGWRAQITSVLPPVQNKPVPEQVAFSAILQLQAHEQDPTYLRTKHCTYKHVEILSLMN